MATWSSTDARRAPGFLRGLLLCLLFGGAVELLTVLIVQLSHSKEGWPLWVLVVASAGPLVLAVRAWKQRAHAHAVGITLGVVLWPPLAVALLLLSTALHYLFTGRALL